MGAGKTAHSGGIRWKGCTIRRLEPRSEAAWVAGLRRVVSAYPMRQHARTSFRLTIPSHRVVQRQLWLMENGVTQYVENQATGDMEPIKVPLTKEQAYDMVRKELYAIRQQEDIERRIASEEARYVGAYFGKSRLEVGMELEDKTFEEWRTWAQAENAKQNAASQSAYANFDEAKVPEVPMDEIDEDAAILETA